MQVQLPDTWKAHTGEAGVDVKEKWFIQVPTIWKMGDSCLKVHLPILVEEEVSIRRERETEQRDMERQIPVDIETTMWTEIQNQKCSHSLDKKTVKHPLYIKYCGRQEDELHVH